MKSLYIRRHDGAIRKTLKAITHGKHGSFLKIVDIGRDELIINLGVVSKRILGWLIPDVTLLECDLSVGRRHVLCTDILLIEVTQAEQTMYTAPGDHALLTPASDPSLQMGRQPHPRQLPAHPNHRKRKIWLLEGGGTSDTRHFEKVIEKQRQLETLLKALDLRGFDTRLGVLTFGVGGSIYKGTQAILSDVGIIPAELKKVLKDIQLHSVEYLHTIVIQRRHLDSQALRHQTPRPP